MRINTIVINRGTNDTLILHTKREEKGRKHILFDITKSCIIERSLFSDELFYCFPSLFFRSVVC